MRTFTLKGMNNIRVNLQSLKGGIYLIFVKENSKTIGITRIIKE